MPVRLVVALVVVVVGCEPGARKMPDAKNHSAGAVPTGGNAIARRAADSAVSASPTEAVQTPAEVSSRERLKELSDDVQDVIKKGELTGAPPEALRALREHQELLSSLEE